jgi:hypothetical protein
MSDTTHPYAEQIRAALSRGVRVEYPQPDGTVIAVVAGGPRIEVDVHLPGVAVPGAGVGDLVANYDAGAVVLPGGSRAPVRDLALYRTEIDGVTVTTYAARR